MSLLAQDERLTRRVGAITLVVLALLFGFFVFVFDQIEWGKRVRIKVYFQTTGGLREGAPFVVAGQSVGEVESIALVPRGTSNVLGNEDGVVVNVALEARAAAKIMYGGDVFVASKGILSSRYLEIGPAPEPKRSLHEGAPAPPGSPQGAPAPTGSQEGATAPTGSQEGATAPTGSQEGATAPTGSPQGAPNRSLEGAPNRSLREGDEIRGKDPPSLDRVLQRTWDNLTTAAAFGAEVRPHMQTLTAEVDALRATLDGIAPDVPLGEDIDALIAEARRSYDALGGEQGLDRIDAVMDRGSATITQARATIAKLRTSADELMAAFATLRGRMGTRGTEAIAKVEAAIDRVREAIDKVDPLLAQVEALQQQIARGEGSLLKLMNDPEFPEDAKELGKILKRQPWKVISRPAK